MKHTKIVATVGPSSESKDVLRALVENGMNVVRLNFSHNEHAWHREVINRVREVSEELKVPVAILADLQGPRIRVGNDHDIAVSRGQRIRITDVSYVAMLPSVMEETIIFDVAGIVATLDVDEMILIEDGIIRAKVVERGEGCVFAVMEDAAMIKPHKGVNLPDTKLDLPILSSHDKHALAFVMQEGVDYVGLSFVGSATDIESAREMMRHLAADPKHIPQIVAKIERKEAIKNLDEILKATDAVMVARGDLGIEMPESEVVILQKDIIRRSLSMVRPVIVATQMMKSMVEHASPTRAEVSDVTNAVVDHADAVMLSEETAMGQHPAETVAIMRDIIERTEESPFDDVYKALDINLKTDYAALIRSVYELAKSFEAKAILLLSVSGFTARLASHFRPDRSILVATTHKLTYHQLALVWGVTPYLFEGETNLDALLENMIEGAKHDGRLASGDQTVVFLGRVPGVHDMMRLIGIRDIR